MAGGARWWAAVGLCLWACAAGGAAGIGANWGTQTSNPLPPGIVVRLLKDNGFQKVKLFDADGAILSALRRSGLEVMVGIPNDMLASLAADVRNAQRWVSQNVSSYLDDGVLIRYVAVGNEPFLQTYNNSFIGTTFPALRNVQSALAAAKLAGSVKATVPLNADVYESGTGLPSGGDFRADIRDLMVGIVQFLAQTGAPFTVNIYPFISLYSDPDFPADYAFFDGGYTVQDGSTTYANVFEANHDTLVRALARNGVPDLPILVGEVGWPTDGYRSANPANAQKFNQGFMNWLRSGRGTPLRPGPMEAYLFSLIDEDQKSIQPGNFERHWGVFAYDGRPKYALSLGGLQPGQAAGPGLVPARGVKYLDRVWCVLKPSARVTARDLPAAVTYACQNGDCTSLGYGSSCGNLDARGNASYAFNNYFQENVQDARACDFDGLAATTDRDPSTPACRFNIMIDNYSAAPALRPAAPLLLFFFFFFFFFFFP
ncbi:glucan endo-1,3-beta-glucosidase 6-like [Wolffia australiana]